MLIVFKLSDWISGSGLACGLNSVVGLVHECNLARTSPAFLPQPPPLEVQKFGSMGVVAA